MLAAGGRGERTRSATLKQLRLLDGVPIFRRCLFALLDAGCNPVVAVLPRDSLDAAGAMVEDLSHVSLVAGCDTRQQSVARGLERIESEVVVVHDGARPLATAGLVSRTIEALRDCDGVVAGIPVEETLKDVVDGRIVSTVDRSRLWRVQTPQTFRTATLRDAHERALEQGLVATDDAQLIESFGGTVKVVEGSRMNVKLTYEEDFEFAEMLLKASQ